ERTDLRIPGSGATSQQRRWSMRHAHGDTNGIPDGNGNLYAYANCYCDVYTDSNGNCHVYAYSDGHGDIYAYSDGHGDIYAYSDRHGYIHANSNSNCYGNSDRGATAFTDATAPADTGASPLAFFRN
ncbi:MAG TPA: hypothetical protein VKB53_03855, partial [Gammaproteobacteria bacterium]|nr:hypothetical protein [Gammaproteobacteria bacterium]